MHPDWARTLRDQCVAAGVPYLFKQWGEWAPIGPTSGLTLEQANGPRHWFQHEGGVIVNRVGKKAAGRVLDGRTWDEFPTVEAATR
jgi:protein gp37